MLKHFVKGMGSVLNIYPARRAYVSSGTADDAKALAGDWKVVGDDLRKSIKNVEQKHNGYNEEQGSRSPALASHYR